MGVEGSPKGPATKKRARGTATSATSQSLEASGDRRLPGPSLPYALKDPGILPCGRARLDMVMLNCGPEPPTQVGRFPPIDPEGMEARRPAREAGSGNEVSDMASNSLPAADIVEFVNHTYVA